MKSWLRLLRISLAPSAAADALAGLVFACGGFPRDARAYWLVPAALGVYHGALALNDWNDRDHDGRTRPARPIPSGAISPALALVTGIGLVLLGVACAALAAPSSAAWMGAVALSAIAYDFAGRGAWSGPLLLGLCRAGNLGSGVFWAWNARISGVDPAWAFGPVLLYGAYVVTVSRLGRLEDGEDARPIGTRPRGMLALSAGFLVLVGGVSVVMPIAIPIYARAAALAVAIAGAWGLVRAAHARTEWTRGDVERAMGLALRRLLIASAVVALLGMRSANFEGAIAAAIILLGYPLAHALRRAFPPS